MGSVEVLMSVMHQKDLSIIKRSNIRSNIVMVNQCNENRIVSTQMGDNLVKCINTTNRGLSNSRNMAIKEATGTYCLLCDDDEILSNDYVEKIKDAFTENPKADVICFIIEREGKKYPSKQFKVGYLKSLKISSVQIVFKTEIIKNNKIVFDENFGAGTENSSGEENIFMFDCLKKNLSIYYTPVVLGKLIPSESTWFQGFNEAYFLKRGRIFRRLFGTYGYIHSLYFAISKYYRYRGKVTIIKAICCLFKGMQQKIEDKKSETNN